MKNDEDLDQSIDKFDKAVNAMIKFPFAVMGSIILATIISAAWSLIWSVPMMYAWNYVMPVIFGLPTISYLQMFCLIFLITDLWKITPVVVRFE